MINLVQYEPAGYHPVPFHPQMEQMAVVQEGRALWELGEVEKEVGPGDVVFPSPICQAWIQGIG